MGIISTQVSYGIAFEKEMMCIFNHLHPIHKAVGAVPVLPLHLLLPPCLLPEPIRSSPQLHKGSAPSPLWFEFCQVPWRPILRQGATSHRVDMVVRLGLPGIHPMPRLQVPPLPGSAHPFSVQKLWLIK